MHILHHLSLGVSDLARAASFYDAALAPLGYIRVCAYPTAIGYGQEAGKDKFSIKLIGGEPPAPGRGFHIAFLAPSRAAVDRFHAAALEHGGQDNGRPGSRPDYGPHYYAAFVIDPDGHHIEAVIDTPA
jgi:catechol 2,3-dioxygenase-like lactoylglutathione lyase family enzyme